MFHSHFCSGFVFHAIFFYFSLLVVLSNSSETIRTKGMKGELCVRIATCFRLIFSCRAVVNFIFLAVRYFRKITTVGCFYFAEEILEFIASHLHTDEREDVICNYFSLISVENSDVEQYSASECKSEIFLNCSECAI